MSHTILDLVTPLALNSTGLQTFLIKNIVPIIMVVIGIVILSKSTQGNVSKTMSISLVAIIGVIFIAGAALIYGFGDQIAHATFN